MNNIKILPSILAADFTNLSKDIAAVEKCDAQGIHCDIMDGHFVPNITFGPMIVRALRSLTDLPILCHLMIEQPEDYVTSFAEAGASEITVHPETCPHLHRTLQQIKDAGCGAGAALNPATPLCAIENVISDLDFLLLMTVNPGFGGQDFIESMLPKISRARQMADSSNPGLDIGVDGGVDVNTVGRIVSAGANALVAGSAVFNGESLARACDEIRRAALAGTG
ncbi:MAG: ribulose-phosphate 3-epimerase [Armatimonadetes bacterium RBG_16_58_9]|nr:MAG: ribulose-phosphate 3-epimerase [Armatimonadetes bacterium RBG_16_58_9]